MSENQNQRKTFVRKAGRTILVKVLNGDFKLENMELEGMVSNHFTEKSNSYFITFDTVQHSLNALREIRKEHNVRAKMAHYKVFFTVEGLNETSDYNTVKTQHRDLIHSISNCSVQFYKLYRREGKYLEI